VLEGGVARKFALEISSNPGASNRLIRLTKREVEVLNLISQGLSSKHTAERLYVSKRTVDFHLANIYEKLKVTNRMQAFNVATNLGFIQDPAEDDDVELD
jgi:hypothetical protein